MGGMLKWFYPGLGIKRWIAVIVFAFTLLLISFTTVVLGVSNLEEINNTLFSIIYDLFGKYTYLTAFLVATASICVIIYATIKANQAIIMFLLPKDDKVVDIMYSKRHLGRGPKLVVIGGGTGLSVLLRGLKQYTSNITAIVTVADDGGSSGRIRGEMGMLPPGDIRNCLVALSEAEPTLEKIFQHRFKTGIGLEGHSFGNLFLAAFTEILGFEQAIKESAKVLAVRGKVLPVTLENIILQAKLKDGSIVRGETNIARSSSPIERISLAPSYARALKDNIEAIGEADAIILGPGSLYTSIIPNLLINDVREAMGKTKAPVYYICNIMTQKGETVNYTAADHLKAIQKHTSKEIIDYIIVNNRDITSRQKHLYILENSTPVKIEKSKVEKLNVEVIEGDMLASSSQVRHDPEKLAKLILTNLLEYHYTGKSFIDRLLLEKKLYQ